METDQLENDDEASNFENKSDIDERNEKNSDEDEKKSNQNVEKLLEDLEELKDSSADNGAVQNTSESNAKQTEGSQKNENDDKTDEELIKDHPQDDSKEQKDESFSINIKSQHCLSSLKVLPSTTITQVHYFVQFNYKQLNFLLN